MHFTKKLNPCLLLSCGSHHNVRVNLVSFGLILYGLVALLAVPDASALIFDRRPKPPATLSWFLYPIVGSIPGVQSFAGVGGTLSGVQESEMDITMVTLGGKAEKFDQGGFHINLLNLLDVPLVEDLLSFSYFYTDITNGSWPEGERGINSDPNQTYYLLASKVKADGGELTTHFLDYQIELYYGYVGGSVTPYGLVAPDGTVYNADDSGIVKQPKGARWGLYWDDTDSRRDPRIGYRIQWDKWAIPASRDENAAYIQTDKNLTLFVPLNTTRSVVMVLNQFQSGAKVTTPGKVNKNRYLCGEGAPANCQTVIDGLYQRQLQNATAGKATSLGGTARLRGYRTNRFYDSHSAFRGAELRWYIIETSDPFNYIIEKGLFSGLQGAIFYEEGTVAPQENQLWAEKKNSYGVGARFLFGSVIFRTDIGVSEESTETTVFVGYPF